MYFFLLSTATKPFNLFDVDFSSSKEIQQPFFSFKHVYHSKYRETFFPTLKVTGVVFLRNIVKYKHEAMKGTTVCPFVFFLLQMKTFMKIFRWVS